MVNWSWAKIEKRLLRHIAKAERQLERLRNYDRGAFGDKLGMTADTPCEVVEDDAQRRVRRREAKKVLGKRPFKGAVICHKCDTPKCVRIDHLFWGTQGDNMRDCYLKGRHPNGKSNVAERIAQLEAKILLWKLQLDNKALISFDASQESP